MPDTVTLCYKALEILLGSTDYSTWRTFGPSVASSVFARFTPLQCGWILAWTKNEMDLGFLVYKYAVRLGLSSKSFCDLITDMCSHGCTVHATLFKNAVVFRVVNYELVFPTELYIEGLGHGNLLEEEAISLLNMVKTLPTELMLKNNCICLAPDANLIRDVSVKYKTETNSVIQLYFQIERAVGLSPPD